jgi:hypothetical protein
VAGALSLGLRPFFLPLFTRLTWKNSSRKFAVTSSAAPVGARGLGPVQSAVLGTFVPTLAAFVARNRCERLRLATDELLENSELLAGLLLAYPHPAPRLDQRRLERGVGVLQA